MYLFISLHAGLCLCLYKIIFCRGYHRQRESYMSAHVLLNLLNELGERDKMRDLQSILSLFRNEFNKFNDTRAQMLDSIYYMTLRLLLDLISAVKNIMILSLYNQRCYRHHNISRKSVDHWWFIYFIAWRYITPKRIVIC